MENATLTKTDTQKIESFLGRVVTDIGSAASVILSYIGDKKGLYKAMAFAGPLSPTDLAKRQDPVKLYLKDWLINQAAGRIP